MVTEAEVEVRPLREDDLPEASVLYFNGNQFRGYLPNPGWQLKSRLECSDPSKYFSLVAQRGGRIVGLMTGFVEKKMGKLDIEVISVLDYEHKEGISERLVDAMLEKAREFKLQLVLIRVATADTSNRELLAKHGFLCQAIKVDYKQETNGLVIEEVEYIKPLSLAVSTST